MKKINKLPFIIGAGVVVLIILFKTSVTIDAGHAGVLFKTFSGGVSTDQPYGEGFHIIAPWNKVILYEVRQQEVKETMSVLSSNGLEIDVDLSVWFQPLYNSLGSLHKEKGKKYIDNVVLPSLRSSTRSVIGRYTPDEIYSSKRDAIQAEIFEETKKFLDKQYVQVNEVLVRDITLPPTIKAAIENKLKQEQEALEYEYRLEKARKEAERQRIDAEGKAAANKILSQSLTDKILMEKGIQATLELANSPNSKIVVIGSGENGMPLILNQ